MFEAMFAIRYSAVLILIAASALAFVVYKTEVSHGNWAFKLGLDLSGGTHLVYNADTSKLQTADIPGTSPRY